MHIPLGGAIIGGALTQPSGPDAQASDFSIDRLLEAGKQLDRGGLTKAGRALSKHGGRIDSVFPKPVGTPEQINDQG